MLNPPSEAPVLQGLWEAVQAGQREVLLSPYLPASYAFLTHVLLCTPFLALDALGSVCQRIPELRAARHRDAARVVQARGVPLLAPSCWELCVEVSRVCWFLYTLFFICHVAMHRVPWLYRRIHRHHHRHHLPFALAAQDSSFSGAPVPAATGPEQLLVGRLPPAQRGRLPPAQQLAGGGRTTADTTCRGLCTACCPAWEEPPCHQAHMFCTTSTTPPISPLGPPLRDIRAPERYLRKER
ncbi:hypothetical protein KUCAC02_028594 [Chaenocephalus aceratus]|uniref:Uncharacterized protein n=1 Tax=Chaenocephalus aceratus TaxID=36190 RepID=A0ACB9X3W1_CHAAC|nr:hypothetical protein KUCAC02_028594 [Chaenocephalus aceratus]